MNAKKLKWFLTLSFTGLLTSFSAEASRSINVYDGIYRQNSPHECDIRAIFRGSAVSISFINNRSGYCFEKKVLVATWGSESRAYCTEDRQDCFEIPNDLSIRHLSTVWPRRLYVFTRD